MDKNIKSAIVNFVGSLDVSIFSRISLSKFWGEKKMAHAHIVPKGELSIARFGKDTDHLEVWNSWKKNRGMK
jgi:hypothetical protein